MLNRPGSLLVLRKSRMFYEDLTRGRGVIGSHDTLFAPTIFVERGTPLLLLEILQDPSNPHIKRKKVIRVLWDKEYLFAYMTNRGINNSFDVSTDFAGAERKTKEGSKLRVIEPLNFHIPSTEEVLTKIILAGHINKDRKYNLLSRDKTKKFIQLVKGDIVTVLFRLEPSSVTSDMNANKIILCVVKCSENTGEREEDNVIYFKHLTRWRIDKSFDDDDEDINSDI